MRFLTFWLLLGLILLIWAAFATVTGWLFAKSGRSRFAGCLTGLFLGWFGIIIGLILQAKEPPRVSARPELSPEEYRNRAAAMGRYYYYGGGGPPPGGKLPS